MLGYSCCFLLMSSVQKELNKLQISGGHEVMLEQTTGAASPGRLCELIAPSAPNTVAMVRYTIGTL